MDTQAALIAALIAEARKHDGDEDAKRARLAALLGASVDNPVLAHLMARHVAETAHAVVVSRPPDADPVATLRAELAATAAALREAQARVVALEGQLAACRASRRRR